MNLSEILREDCISLSLAKTTKAEVIREMVDLLSASGKVDDADELYEALMERENLQSTGIGQEMAIPHAKAEGVKGLLLGLGIAPQGIEFNSLDNQPVKLIFVLAGEPRLQTSFLSILSKISRLFRRGDFSEQILQAGSPQDVIALFQAREEQ